MPDREGHIASSDVLRLAASSHSTAEASERAQQAASEEAQRNAGGGDANAYNTSGSHSERQAVLGRVRFRS